MIKSEQTCYTVECDVGIGIDECCEQITGTMNEIESAGWKMETTPIGEGEYICRFRCPKHIAPYFALRNPFVRRREHE